MGYGQTKMSSAEAVDGILDAIRKSLLNSDAFSSTSICYFGVELEYTIDLKLHSRGYVETQVKGETLVGPPGEPGVKTDENPQVVKVEGRKIAGKVPEVRLKNAAGGGKFEKSVAGAKAD